MHVTFANTGNDPPKRLKTKDKDKGKSKQYMAESLKRVQNMVKMDSAEDFMFNLERSTEFANLLQQSIKENDVVIFEVNGKKFSVVYEEMTPILISKHMTIRKYSEIIQSEEMEMFAERLMWVIIYDMLMNRVLNKNLSQTRGRLYNVLSISFLKMRRRLSLIPNNAYESLIEFYSAEICAVIFILLLHSHQESELYSNVPFVKKTENSVRDLIVGFSSPNINGFHSIVFGLIPQWMKTSIPTKLNIGGEEYNKDITSTISYEPQIVNEWNSRKNCLFQATSQTGLMANAMKLRGSAAPIQQKTHSVVRGSVEKSQFPMEKVTKIKNSIDDIVKEHVDDTKELLDTLRQYEREYLEAPHLATNVKPLGMTFASFQPDVNLPGVFQETLRSPRRYKLDNLPPRKKRLLDIKQMNLELESARTQLHDELRNSYYLSSNRTNNS